ncbi:RiPP maturation radical SAM protein 1 [Kribbella antibiotica]|uniref:RiPP maturation radical SAM protein 1 n=1 Tax=Kribbella antibiotica TaxID=190195 RepID=A0A4R4ZJX1_9ACTN|nr:RiPP maturation radical SAM C-methyltransferase [Kribbella antibiotica]TDD58336.1 RiPP maturation radical SAM protein 1 [Kribbella antibiotica]
MKVTLVNMPWALIDSPSLAVGILHNLAAGVPGCEVDVIHANLELVDWMSQRSPFTLAGYQQHSVETYFLGHGDWVFSSALSTDVRGRPAEFTHHFKDSLTAEQLALTLRLHELAPEFIDHVADLILATDPDVVGFTSTFQQNTAALAAAQRVKQLRPEVVTVLGGANCEGAQGAAIHRNFRCMDFVVRGEGESVFPRLLEGLRSGCTHFEDLEGVCWWDAEGASVPNPTNASPIPPNSIVPPNYDSYFARLATSVARRWVEPKLVVESARGCWWGEKHHCTFCGLNGSLMKFRSKDPDTFYEEIIGLAGRHRVLDMFVVDNILDMGYLKSVIPRLVDSGYDLRLMWEIKSNLRLDQLRSLVRAGVTHVQPGIESLNSNVLSLMDKGVRGCQNVRLLRDAESAGLTVSWNYLYGFPGERDVDYQDVIAQLPALHHLPPSEAGRVVLERFSPYFDRPELGFVERRPRPQYAMTYDLPPEELEDLAYLFETPKQGIGDELAESLDRAVTQWRDAYLESRLTYTDLGHQIVLISRRSEFSWSAKELTTRAELGMFRLLQQPRTVRFLHSELAGVVTSPDALDDLLTEWRGLGLLFFDGEQLVQVAVEEANQNLLRIKSWTTRQKPNRAIRETGAPV